MTIRINVSNHQKMLYLVELLKTMNFVESLKVEAEVIEPPKSLSFFEKYNGCMPNLDVQAFEANQGNLASKYWGAWKTNPLSIEKIDYEIRKMRAEWDRDIY